MVKQRGPLTVRRPPPCGWTMRETKAMDNRAQIALPAERAIEPALDPLAAARAASLRYVSDAMPGITRRRAGTGVAYRDPRGQLIRDRSVLKRIRSLAVPPAWTDVWICPDPNGHIQAVGRDARGRKQYRYHPSWRSVRDEAKYGRMLLFARVLPRIRARVEADLALRGLPRQRVLAALVRLLEVALARVGNTEYARENKSFGLTTLRNRHARVRGGSVEFDFRGKHGIQHLSRSKIRGSPGLSANARTSRDRTSFSMSTTRDSAAPWARTTSTIICASFPARRSRQRTSAPGRGPIWRPLRCASWRRRRARRRPNRTFCAPSRRSPRCSATRRRSGANATSIPPSSRAISTAACWRCWKNPAPGPAMTSLA